VTKLDVLDGLGKLMVCVAYEINGKKINYFPTNLEKLNLCRPVYEELPGWQEDTSKVKEYRDLPENAQKYLSKLSALAGIPIRLISTGAERGAIIVV
jgi:adenylosuccinate synthase